MKQITILIFTILLVANGCTNNDTIVENSKGKITVIDALLSQPETKTVLGGVSGLKVLWGSDDEICIISDADNQTEMSNFTSMATTPSTIASFSGTASLGGKIVAYYPSGSVFNYNTVNNSFTVYLYLTQPYKADGFQDGYNPAAAYINEWEEGSKLVFKNLCTLLKITVTAPTEEDIIVKSIAIYSKTKALSGEAEVKYLSSNYVLMTKSLTERGYNSILLYCENESGGGVMIPKGEERAFFMVVPSGNYPSKDLTMVIQTKNNGIMIKETSNTLSLSASKIKPIAITYSKTNLDYCGYGDGVAFDLGALGVKVFAPVNCGYEPSTDESKGYKYGKLYQWGRKDGQGYNSNDASTPLIEETIYDPSTSIFSNNGGSPKPNTFYKTDNNTITYDWYAIKASAQLSLWGNDPCPEGWRVPNYEELSRLLENRPYWGSGTHGSNTNMVGRSIRGNHGTLFFPAAGFRNAGGSIRERDSYGRYWTTGLSDILAEYWHFAYGDTNIYTLRRAYGFSVRCIKR